MHSPPFASQPKTSANHLGPLPPAGLESTGHQGGDKSWAPLMRSPSAAKGDWGDLLSDEQFKCLLLSNESHPKYSKASYQLRTGRLSHETSCLLSGCWHPTFCMIEIKAALILVQEVYHNWSFTWERHKRTRNSIKLKEIYLLLRHK